MDNTEPMWSQDPYGNYWLLFPNKHALEKEEIREIFSEYGKVIKVSTAGDERGLRFVQYATSIEAERAVNNLRNHPKIRLVPYRPKNNKKDQLSNNASNDTENCYNGSKQNHNDNNKQNFYQRKPIIKKTEIQSYRSFGDKSYVLSGDSSHAQEQNDENNICQLHIKNDAQSEKIFNDRRSISSQTNSQQQNNDNESVCSNVSVQFNSNLTSPAKSVERKSSLSSGNSMNAMKKLLQLKHSLNTNISCLSDDAIPNLVTKYNHRLNIKPKAVILNAEEVIVGNLQESITSAYILHLFDSYQPLAITYVSVVPNTSLRFCHVYFKTRQDSIEVEERFDNYDLAGKKLIVLRACRLKEKAMS